MNWLLESLDSEMVRQRYYNVQDEHTFRCVQKGRWPPKKTAPHLYLIYLLLILGMG